MQDTEHVFGRTGIQRAGRFVEHEHARMACQDRTDRDALALPAGQRSQWARPQICQTE